jgi:hypothetical protein
MVGNHRSRKQRLNLLFLRHLQTAFFRSAELGN